MTYEIYDDNKSLKNHKHLLTPYVWRIFERIGAKIFHSFFWMSWIIQNLKIERIKYFDILKRKMITFNFAESGFKSIRCYINIICKIGYMIVKFNIWKKMVKISTSSSITISRIWLISSIWRLQKYYCNNKMIV